MPVVKKSKESIFKTLNLKKMMKGTQAKCKSYTLVCMCNFEEIIKISSLASSEVVR